MGVFVLRQVVSVLAILACAPLSKRFDKIPNLLDCFIYGRYIYFVASHKPILVEESLEYTKSMESFRPVLSEMAFMLQELIQLGIGDYTFFSTHYLMDMAWAYPHVYPLIPKVETPEQRADRLGRAYAKRLGDFLEYRGWDRYRRRELEESIDSKMGPALLQLESFAALCNQAGRPTFTFAQIIQHPFVQIPV